MTDLTDEKSQDILKMVQTECARSIGFDDVNSGELAEQREKALNYYKGDMPDLVMQLKGRSKVVSTDVADAIETAMPDLIDIFTGGDDVITFEPVAEDDVETAQQETDYLYHLVFNKNNGWQVFYEAFKDALTCKTGVFSWRWDGEFTPPSEHHEGKSVMELLKAGMEGELSDVMQGEPDDMGNPTFSYEFTPKNAKGRIVIESIPSEDLSVATDTKTLATATYCVVRQRPRAQDLIALGFDPELINSLPEWRENGSNVEAYARDTVAETQMATGSALQPLRQVEIYRHYIRYYEEDEKRYCLYQVITGGAGHTGTLLDIEEVSRIQLAAITPFINPHRFYGFSLADKLIEIQKIKTSLQRMALDMGYFGLNQRFEVAEDGSTPDTLNDILNNEPGMPIRVKRAGTINGVSAGGLNYDPLSHLEYFSVVGEQRTGIVRNAQGLNPDTLHDTAKGLEVLANSAQKRLRMIARTFAETGVKDFLVNLHATVRENGASMRDTVRLRGKEFVEIDPSTWRQRDDMVIQIGVGAGGREHNMIVGQQIGAIQEKLLMAQQAPVGPLLDQEKIYNAAVFAIKSLGVKSPEQFVSDPKTFQAPPPQPDPAQAEAAAKMQMEQERLQLDTAKAQHDAMLKEQSAQTDLQLGQMKLEAEIALKREQMNAEFALKREQMAMEFELKRQQTEMEAALKVRQQNTDAEINSNVQFGGEVG